MKMRIKPGTFAEVPEGVHCKPVKPVRLKVETTPLLVDIYKKFADKHGMPSHVLYPGCAYDVSPSKVFSDVVYVDQEEHYVRALREAGYNAFAMRVQDYIPDRDFDLLIVMRFHLPDPHPSRLLERGHIICDYYQSDKLFSNPDFAFVESLNPSGHKIEKGRGYSLFRRRK